MFSFGCSSVSRASFNAHVTRNLLSPVRASATRYQSRTREQRDAYQRSSPLTRPRFKIAQYSLNWKRRNFQTADLHCGWRHCIAVRHFNTTCFHLSLPHSPVIYQTNEDKDLGQSVSGQRKISKCENRIFLEHPRRLAS